MTTNSQMAYAHEIAAKLEKELVFSCSVIVEDWSDFALFHLNICFPFIHVDVKGKESYHFCDKVNPDHAMEGILQLIAPLKIENIFMVLPLAVQQYIEGKVVIPQGYSSPTIMLDFHVLPM